MGRQLIFAPFLPLSSIPYLPNSQLSPPNLLSYFTNPLLFLIGKADQKGQRRDFSPPQEPAISEIEADEESALNTIPSTPIMESISPPLDSD